MESITDGNVKEMSFIDMLVEQRRNGKFGGSGYILGAPGSGVSMSAKQQIISILQNSDEDVVVIDTEGRYSALAKQMGGQVIPIGFYKDTKNPVYINPFDINLFDDEAGFPLILKKDFIIAWLEASFASRYGLAPGQKSIVERCIKRVYEPYIDSWDPETLQYDPQLLPTVKDFQKEVRSYVGFDAYLLADYVDIFVNGSWEMFSHPTNIEHNKRFVVYDLSVCGMAAAPFCALIVAEHVWTHCIAMDEGHWPRSRQWLFVDDLRPILSSSASAEYWRWLFKAARPRGCVFTGVTRDVPTFLEADSWQWFLGCSDYIHLLPLGQVEQKYFAARLNLSPPQVQFLGKARTGQSLIYQFERLIEVHGFNNVKTYRFDKGWVKNLEETECPETVN